MKSYTVDFEKPLINALKIVFNKSIAIGCYFHYTRALRQKGRELGLLGESNKNLFMELLKYLYIMPIIYHKDKNKLNGI